MNKRYTVISVPTKGGPTYRIYDRINQCSIDGGFDTQKWAESVAEMMEEKCSKERKGRQVSADAEEVGRDGRWRRMIAIYTQNRQAVWNFADISRFHVTGNGTGIQAVAKNGAGGEIARYKSREQCTYVLEMLMSAFDADERTFIFPAEKELEHAKQHGATGGGKRHGGS